MDFEHVIPSERGQMQNSPGYVMPPLGNVQKAHIREAVAGWRLGDVTA